ncbi:hypothetical protein GCM10009676_30910 [Prauserella halophila]|uniref:Secreted protein n=1 Tax=Prauserella halophila TaxID=185641 RepID=A0ABN1WAK4_9PSEU|nr:MULTISPECIES: hypothetical protein [Prauserella]MCP2234719.1 hypothetical protein [Prauserella halophila]MCP2252172.1 hypothetical protein [Prauserella aidingensis]
MTEKQQTPSAAKRWTMRGLAVSALAVPMVAVLGGTASAAELTPIAEYLDETIAATSASLVEALGVLLGVS